MRWNCVVVRCLLLFALAVALLPVGSVSGSGGEFRLNVVDAETREPIACRMHLKNAKGAPHKVPRVPYWHDHFVFPGKIALKLPKGTYTFELDHGPEYTNRQGHFTIDDFADDEQVIDLKRSIDMAAEGWWSGDLHIHRSEKDIRLLMEAEDLHVAPLITWWNDKNPWQGKTPPKERIVRFDENRIYDVLGGEDERGGGALLFFNLPEPLDLGGATREFPPSARFLVAASRHENAWVDAEKPFWWDMPIWLASGKIDSIGLANNHLQRDATVTNEAWGKPRDRVRLRGSHGNAQWSEEIYYHVLNSGLRIPPSAGSASGVIPNPVGYNRVYVWVDRHEFSYDAWWEGFKAGRVIVTNGPLIQPFANNRLPGQVFQAKAGEKLELEVTLNLATREKINYLELVKDGRVVQSVRLDEVAETGHLPPVEFTESGWLLVRAVTENEQTYHFVSTAPWYVEFDGQPRISRAAAQFFLDWTNERAAKVQVEDDSQRKEVMKFIDAARRYWQQRVENATAP